MNKNIIQITNQLPQIINSYAGFHGCPIDYYSQETGMMSVSKGIVNSINSKKRIILENNTTKNESVLIKETAMLAVNCGLAGVAVVGVLAGGGAAVASGGTTIPLAVAAYVGFISSSAQCINSILRLKTVLDEPDSNSLEMLDNEEDYLLAQRIIDAVGIVSGVSTLKSQFGSISNLSSLLRNNNVFSSFQDVTKLGKYELVKVIRNFRSVAKQSKIAKIEFEAAFKPFGLKSMSNSNLAKLNKSQLIQIESKLNSNNLKNMGIEIAQLIPTGVSGVLSSTDKDAGSLGWTLHAINP